MEKRSHESPMDFEWQTHAPADASSPFTKHTMSYHESQKDPQLKKRPYGAFESPAKPSTPALREPASQPFLFSQTPSSKPASAFRNQSFTTPRKIDIDFSSGPDTPDNADNEDTPEPARSTAHKTSNAVTHFTSNKKADKKQHPLFAMYGKFAASPGRGELARGNVYSNGITKRVRRQRREREREQRLTNRRPDQDSDSSRPSSSDGANSTTKQAPPPREIGLIPSVLSFIDTHPNLPHVLSYYAQLLLNLFLVFFLIYIIYSFWSTIRSDVDKASEEVAAETLAEMAVCAREYVDNRCDRDSRVPAMERVCDNWEKCMNKDPHSVGRATVSAHTFARIFNSFVEPISYKAMIFSLTLIFGCVAISNFAFSFFRNRTAHPPPPPPFAHSQPQQQQHMRYPSVGHEQGFYTPYQSHAGMLALEPGLGGRSPVRRLGYR